MQVKATIKASGGQAGGKKLASQIVSFTSPFVGEGIEYWLKEKSKWLKSTVGPILYWVIIVVAILLLLVVLWLAFKLVKALVMKIVGMVLKKGKGAATSAAKGGRG